MLLQVACCHQWNPQFTTENFDTSNRYVQQTFPEKFGPCSPYVGETTASLFEESWVPRLWVWRRRRTSLSISLPWKWHHSTSWNCLLSLMIAEACFNNKHVSFSSIYIQTGQVISTLPWFYSQNMRSFTTGFIAILAGCLGLLEIHSLNKGRKSWMLLKWTNSAFGWSTQHALL